MPAAIELDQSLEQFVVRRLPNEDEHRRDGQLGDLARLHVLQRDARHLLVAFDALDHGVPGEGEPRVRARPVLEDLARLERVAAVDEVDLARVPRDEEALVERGIAAAHDRDLDVLEERSVAGGAVAHALARQFRLAGHAEVVVLRPSGHDHRTREVLLAGGRDPKAAVLCAFERGRAFVDELRPELLRLLEDVLGEVEAVHALGKARVILHEVGRRNLTARDHAFEDDGGTASAGAIDGGGQPGAAAANDRDITFSHCQSLGAFASGTISHQDTKNQRTPRDVFSFFVSLVAWWPTAPSATRRGLRRCASSGHSSGGSRQSCPSVRRP